MLLGVDTGGTFTDFVLYSKQGLRIHKVLSTPHAPEQAILEGIKALGLEGDPELTIIHGSTVATNAVLEGKGVRTAYITNRGLADVLSIGRQARRALYDLQPVAKLPPVAAELCLETGGRLAADGREIEPLTDADLTALRTALLELKPDAVAINLLFSFLDDRAEKAIAESIPDGIFISRSSAVLAEIKEYERGITTWLNASVGPLVQGYLLRLQQGVEPASVSVMQSSGLTISASQAGERAVHLLLSGPAGGLAGAQFVAGTAGKQRLLSFDMGGTSTDVALIDQHISITTQAQIAGYPVAVPMVDMHTIGAGGGSLASVDEGGLLQVGPESAGAMPGPACYGQGGQQATVTDANLVLGRLQATAFLGGEMRLDLDAARQAIEKIALTLCLSIEDAARGIIQIANEHMARALRVISLQRGIDPREFTLASFGGAGGLHVCALADALGVREAIVPVHGGVLSALGMLVAPRGREYTRGINKAFASMSSEAINRIIDELATRGRQALASEGVPESILSMTAFVDVCYQGQSSSLTIHWDTVTAAIEAFHHAHQQRYGHQLDLPVELVSVRVRLQAEAMQVSLNRDTPNTTASVEKVRVYGVDEPVVVYQREQLREGHMIEGPALITEKVSTTWIEQGWQASLHPSGSLLLSKID